MPRCRMRFPEAFKQRGPFVREYLIAGHGGHVDRRARRAGGLLESRVPQSA
ncbi:MAG: hypothetical protein LBR95_03235 [Azoarcus sp.]|nr:hypothetical protein [Azoarcus sp.]